MFINLFVYQSGKAWIVSPERAPKTQAIMVLGAYAHQSGKPSRILKDRLQRGLELYQKGVAPKILVTGDHGQIDYDEVNAMRAFLEEQGVPPEDIFMDHAGFDTYDSMSRAQSVFEVETLLIVTQEFHLIRALYIARALGLEAHGVTSDLSVYQSESYLQRRELLARIKAFLDVNSARDPIFGGPAIPITGDGRKSHD